MSLMVDVFQKLAKTKLSKTRVPVTLIMVVTSRMYLESVEGISRGWFFNPELNFFLFLNGVRILSVTKSLCILNCFCSHYFAC